MIKGTLEIHALNIKDLLQEIDVDVPHIAAAKFLENTEIVSIACGAQTGEPGIEYKIAEKQVFVRGLGF